MMTKLTAVLVIIIGILLVLPLLGVTALGTMPAWITAIIVLAIGVMGLLEKPAM